MFGELNEEASLEALSPELLTQILLAISTREGLYSIIRVSPRCYQIFLTSKAKILTSLVQQTIHPAAVMDALTAVRALQLKDSRPDRKQILEFIQRYEKSKNKVVDLAKERLSIPMAVKLFRLRWATLSFYNDVDGLTTLEEPILAPGKPLTTKEQGPFQHACYRHEIYTHLFDPDIQINGRRMFKDSHSSHFFLEKFALQEILNMHLVDIALRTWVEQALDRFEQVSADEETLTFSLDGTGIASLGLPWSIMRTSITEYLLSMGLAQLDRFRKATEEEQRRIISSHVGNDTIIGRNSLEAALKSYY